MDVMEKEVQTAKKRAPNKTIEERKERIDQKIQWHEKAIESLKAQRAKLDEPKLSRSEKVQMLLEEKVVSGVLSLKEAKTLGYKGS